jgi:hypothetical protein
MSDIRAALVGKLPTGDGNGLNAIAGDLVKDPRRLRVAVIIFDVEDIDEKVRKDYTAARVCIRRVEVVRDSGDGAAMQRILMREFERRTGQTTLPFELEQEVEAAFAGLDTDEVAVAEREAAEGHVEHAGATEDWSPMAELDAVNPAVCEQCGTEIHYDEAVPGWLDTNGFPAADGHHHAPKTPETGEDQ